MVAAVRSEMHILAPVIGNHRAPRSDGADRSSANSRAPNCDEEQKDRPPVYTAAEFDCVRVEACETCRAYIKAVDLTRNGLAVPVVDEIATVALNIWAEEHGYRKVESNLLRM